MEVVVNKLIEAKSAAGVEEHERAQRASERAIEQLQPVLMQSTRCLACTCSLQTCNGIRYIQPCMLRSILTIRASSPAPDGKRRYVNFVMKYHLKAKVVA